MAFIAITVLLAFTRIYVCLLHFRVRLVQVRLSLWLSTMPQRNMEVWRHSSLSCPLHTGEKSRWYTSSRRLCGSQSLSGRLAEEKHRLCRESSHGLSVAQSLCQYSRYGCVGVRLLNRCLRTCVRQTDVSAM